MKNETKLIKWGLEKNVMFYYHKFGKGAQNFQDGYLGVATICVVGEMLSQTPKHVYVRGIAFCNSKDQFNKKRGRAIALGRAVKAIEHRQMADPISRSNPAIILASVFGWKYLSQWDITLTMAEKEKERIFMLN